MAVSSQSARIPTQLKVNDHHMNTTPPPLPTTADLSDLAARLFQDGSTKLRLMQKYRPYICPFDLLIQYVPQGANMLDVGCGGGLFLGLLAGLDHIKSGHGFDTSEAAIGTAQKMADRAQASGHETNLLFEVRSADAAWPEDTYDVVSLIDVMHHVPPLAHQKVIENAIQRVNPGGKFIYKDMCQRPLWRAIANRMHDIVLAQEWINYLDMEKVRQWGINQGLTIEHESTTNLFWYGHELTVFTKPLVD